MKKLFAILATTGAIAVAMPAMAQGIDVRIGTGMHRPHHRTVIVRHPHRDVVVVHKRHNWHHARRNNNTVVIR
jgi:hypothetical protein